jgi:uncharacterized protein YjbJ (UPF0337 family)
MRLNSRALTSTARALRQGRAAATLRQRERDMDHKRTEGMGHEIKGKVKETTGRVTGNRSQQLEGNLEKNAGKAERHLGEAQDDLRHTQQDHDRHHS